MYSSVIYHFVVFTLESRLDQKVPTLVVSDNSIMGTLLQIRRLGFETKMLRLLKNNLIKSYEMSPKKIGLALNLQNFMALIGTLYAMVEIFLAENRFKWEWGSFGSSPCGLSHGNLRLRLQFFHILTSWLEQCVGLSWRMYQNRSKIEHCSYL